MLRPGAAMHVTQIDHPAWETGNLDARFASRQSHASDGKCPPRKGNGQFGCKKLQLHFGIVPAQCRAFRQKGAEAPKRSWVPTESGTQRCFYLPVLHASRRRCLLGPPDACMPAPIRGTVACTQGANPGPTDLQGEQGHNRQGWSCTCIKGAGKGTPEPPHWWTMKLQIPMRLRPFCPQLRGGR